jgi:hypothetical protein
MGHLTIEPCIKGPACQALDNISSSRAALTQLQTALVGISAAKFAGLENVLAQYLLPARQPAYTPVEIDNIRVHLKANWFDPTSPSCFFPGLEVANIYGVGLLKTLELALSRNVPIDAWWALDHVVMDMLNFATPRQVTLVIATPRPAGQLQSLSVTASEPTVGFSTRNLQGSIQSRKLQIP